MDGEWENWSSRDYLQDPAMWGDRLPQPYRMIDHILNNLLIDTWDLIQRKVIFKQREAAHVQVPESRNGWVLCRDELREAYGGVGSGRDVLFVGNGNHVCAMRYRPNVGEIIADHELQHEVVRLVVIQKADIYFIFLQFHAEIKILGYVQNRFIELAEISHQSKDVSGKIVETTLSSTCSHLGITFNSSPPSESGQMKLGIHQLPVESWMTELPLTVDERSQVSMASHKEVVFSKTGLLYVLSSPLTPIIPSTATSPFSAFQSVCDQAGALVPSGELHSLTKVYFENRRRLFVSKRQDFVVAEDTTTASENLPQCQQPTCHFLHYNSNCKQAVACEVAVWWETQLYLTFYPLEEPNAKISTAHPIRRIPQASPIICSSTNKDSSMLALGLQNGVLVLWDMKLGLCCKVVSCVNPPDEISALKFFQSVSIGGLLGIGTAQGKVLTLDTASDSRSPPTPLSYRIMNQQEVHGEMFTSSGYDIESKVVRFEFTSHLPSLLTTVHANGTMITWDPLQQEAIYRFVLDENFTPSAPISCTFSGNGHHIFITGKLAESEANCYVIGFDLRHIPSLECHWVPSPSSSSSSSTDSESLQDRGKMSLLDPAQTHLKNYVTHIVLEMDENLKKWHEHWKELPNRLIEPRS